MAAVGLKQQLQVMPEFESLQSQCCGVLPVVGNVEEQDGYYWGLCSFCGDAVPFSTKGDRDIKNHFMP